MSLTDFIIGALIVNAMPHLIFGLTKTHFLGLFGYSPKGNIAYALLQLVAGVFLFVYTYGFNALLQNGFIIGGLTVLILFFIFGKFMLGFYQKK